MEDLDELPVIKPTPTVIRPDDHAVRNGRIIVICVNAVILGLSFLTICLSVATAESQVHPTQIVRFAMSIAS